MIILHDEASLLHETVELLGAKIIPALESPRRVEAIVAETLERKQHDLQTISVSPQNEADVLHYARLTHDTGYIDHLQSVFAQWRSQNLIEADGSVLPECFRLHSSTSSHHQSLKPPKDIYARAGYYAFDMSTGITQNSWKAIVAAANLALHAAKLISEPDSSSGTTNQQPKCVVALTRPPGHHCTGQQAGGYCYINNAVIASSFLRAYHSQMHKDNVNAGGDGTSRIAILDLDFHHGNGTQELTYADPDIMYVSVHGEDEFPYYTGSADETGVGSAKGTNVNLPLATNSSFETYLAALQVGLAAVQQFRPTSLIVSLGFDTFHLDPLGKFGIETEDYQTMAKTVRESLPAIPAIILLEGGYVVDRLGSNLHSFLAGWELAEHAG